MLTKTLTALFLRDLTKLQDEIKLYSNELLLWEVQTGIPNSAGNLALHVIGNLNCFIGDGLGNTGYVRQRSMEFSQKNIPLKTLIENIEQTKIMIKHTLESISETDLQKEYKRNPFEYYMTTEYFLVHLAMHLAYHLGQINYHRRMLNESDMLICTNSSD